MTSEQANRAEVTEYEVRGCSGNWRLIEVATGRELRRSQYRWDLLDNYPNTVLVDEGRPT
jgi:hypothetical protein